MKLDLYQVDAFTESTFGGNPACIVPLTAWLDDDVLLNIAKENAVAETAFFVQQADRIHLRWFTPDIEMDLCGHATLATAHILKTELGYEKNSVVFDSASGLLTVHLEDGFYEMDFPSRMPMVAELPDAIKNALSLQPTEVYKSRDFVLVYDKQEDIEQIEIESQFFDQINLDPGGLIITAKGDECDFVSRFFTPQSTILEDPVTGSAHCSLTPFWAERLGKLKMTAVQLSARQGKLYCTNNADRVLIGGHAKTYSVGVLWTE